MLVEIPDCASPPYNCFADFPIIGFDDSAFWVAATAFTEPKQELAGAILIAVSKADLVDGKGCAKSARYTEALWATDKFGYFFPSSIQPNSKNTTGNTTYIFYNLASNSSSCIISATATDLLRDNKAPRLSTCTPFTTFLTTTPENATQANNVSLYTSIKYPGSSVTYLDGRLYAMGLTGVTRNDGFSGDLSALSWFVMDPQKPELYKGGTIAVNDTDLFMGAVAATSGGNIVFTCIATNRTTPGYFSVRGVINVAQGVVSDMFYFTGNYGGTPVNIGKYGDFPQRVGDYSAIVAGDNDRFYGSSQTSEAFFNNSSYDVFDWGSIIWGGLKVP
eukprot:jgi/Botrbrau1/5711/Bobra.0071s0042.1